MKYQYFFLQLCSMLKDFLAIFKVFIEICIASKIKNLIYQCFQRLKKWFKEVENGLNQNCETKERVILCRFTLSIIWSHRY